MASIGVALPDGDVVELRPHPEGFDASHDVSGLLDLDAPAAEIAARIDLPGYDAGTRVPGCVDGEEIAVRAVLGQQISIQAASDPRGAARGRGGGAAGAPGRRGHAPLSDAGSDRARRPTARSRCRRRAGTRCAHSPGSRSTA